MEQVQLIIITSLMEEIHDTDNSNYGAGAINHYNFFNGGNRGSSADYFIDDKNIVQVVEDTNCSWAVGDGEGKYGITNRNSVSIEICINPESNYDIAVNYTLELTRLLMNKYGISEKKVVRHYDASRKICPKSMSANGWAKWNEFKSRLTIKPPARKKINIDTEWLKDRQINPVDALYVAPRYSKQEISSQEPMGLIRGALKSMRRVQKKK